MSNQKIKYNILVTIQFTCIMYIVISGRVFLKSSLLLGIEITGFLLGVWAVLAMKPGNFNITPEVKINSKLVVKGPYKIVRHPMYLAILLFLTPMVIEDYSYPRLFVMILLTTLLIVKTYIEEKLLNLKFEGYKYYIRKTWRLVPFIF